MSRLTDLYEQAAIMDEKIGRMQAAGDALAEAVESFRGYTTYEPIREALQQLIAAWNQAKEMK